MDNKENLDKCQNCGRFLNPNEDAFYAREHPDCDMSYMVAFCNKNCAASYEQKYYASVAA